MLCIHLYSVVVDNGIFGDGMHRGERKKAWNLTTIHCFDPLLVVTWILFRQVLTALSCRLRPLAPTFRDFLSLSSVCKSPPLTHYTPIGLHRASFFLESMLFRVNKQWAERWLC